MTTEAFASSRRAVVNRLFWRVHFWAGLVTAPIVLFAALTGLLYACSPQIEAWRHADVNRVPVRATMQPLDAQVAAAQAALPGAGLRFVVPAHEPGETTQVYLREPHEGHAHAREHDHGLPRGTIVYVDPYTAQVVGHLPEMQRFKTWARKLHSSALQGDGLRWPMEDRDEQADRARRAALVAGICRSPRQQPAAARCLLGGARCSSRRARRHQPTA